MFRTFARRYGKISEDSLKVVKVFALNQQNYLHKTMPYTLNLTQGFTKPASIILEYFIFEATYILKLFLIIGGMLLRRQRR